MNFEQPVNGCGQEPRVRPETLLEEKGRIESVVTVLENIPHMPEGVLQVLHRSANFFHACAELVADLQKQLEHQNQILLEPIGSKTEFRNPRSLSSDRVPKYHRASEDLHKYVTELENDKHRLTRILRICRGPTEDLHDLVFSKDRLNRKDVEQIREFAKIIEQGLHGVESQ